MRFAPFGGRMRSDQKIICANCGKPMRLASLTTNPIYEHAPPVARFECDCGSSVTSLWRAAPIPQPHKDQRDVA